ncbi:hypothetical protein BU23DRAFT_584787 [Bimuria novae-zelandiae CBS 107.79]|uniref:Cation/H+ exchanger transmembrane domain-containing protein n=1 Tax=Bimuria novae-zelandiae CBS 107.79 TaxID=1447943 RepID=A0A6A5UM07_9PLEO|nr:hypothetical protein BU23DRAFT_584787 [Bimuria novae-zelandiae CBS 107.79]
MDLRVRASEKIIRAGIIFGAPLANTLHHAWQETFMSLGYIGLIPLIFEGGLTTRMDLLKANFGLSLVAATTGVLCPIGFSYLLLYLGFGYGAVETFIIGAALTGASKSVDHSQTRVSAVLVSAAVMDDVSGLVMNSRIPRIVHRAPDRRLRRLLTPILTKCFFAPVFRRYIAPFRKDGPSLQHLLMILVLSAFIAVAAYTGTSVLFGAFLAGTFLAYILSKHPEARRLNAPTFVHTFECYCLDVQQGVVYTLLMLVAKFVVGSWVPISSGFAPEASFSTGDKEAGNGNGNGIVEQPPTRLAASKASMHPALLLGMAMVARGEIGLLIVEIESNNTPYVTSDGFITAIWAILPNIIIGPICVGVLVKFRGELIAKGMWGLVEAPGQGSDEVRSSEVQMEEARQ